MQRDPLVRLRNYLTERTLWDSTREEALQTKAKEQVAAAVKRAEEIAAIPSSEIFDAMYAEIPDEVRRQRDTMRTGSLGQDPTELGIEASHPPGVEETV